MAWLVIDGSISSDMSTLGILAFEAAKTMSRLVALYNSLADDQFTKLREGPMKSPGVAYLNSIDERYLLGLACEEKLEELNHAVDVVVRLSKKCIDESLNMFETTYHDMTQGRINIDVVNNVDFNTRNIGKAVDKMEKYVNSTSKLHASMVALDDLEASEKKRKKRKSDDVDYFDEKITFRRKQVQKFRQISLWNQTFDRTVGLMSRIVFVVYARICTIFGPFVPNLPFFHIPKRKSNFHMKIHPETNYCLLVDKDKYTNQGSKSGPITKSPKIKSIPRRSNSGELARFSSTRNKRLLIHSAHVDTVGSAGLAVRYANIIVMAESCFYSMSKIDNEAREDMFEMLPTRLKHALGKKLKVHWCEDEIVSSSGSGSGLAEGWIDALEEIIGWLAPMAHDTLKWQRERDLSGQKLDAKPVVLSLQTLYFSDLEKTEAAIVEVLVGLSCIYRYEKRRERNCDGGYCWL